MSLTIKIFLTEIIRPGKVFPILIIIALLGIMGPLFAQNLLESNPSQESISHLNPRPLSYSLDTSQARLVYDRNGESRPVITGLNSQQYSEKFKTQTIETFIKPRQQIEYMINMDQGDILLYSWEIDGRVYFDLHGHQDNVDPEIWTRYVDGQENTSHGSFTAPYTGEHGWLWVNMDTKPVKITLTVSGYYKNIFRIDL